MQKNPFTIYCLQKLKEQGRRFLLIWYNNPMIFRSYFCKLWLIPAHDPQFLVQKLNTSNHLFRKSISTPVCRIHSIFQYICPISYEHEKTAPHLNPLSYIHIFTYRISSRTTQFFLMWEIQTEIFITIHLARDMKVETLINIYFSLVFRQNPMHAFYKIKKRAFWLKADSMTAQPVMTHTFTDFLANRADNASYCFLFSCPFSCPYVKVCHKISSAPRPFHPAKLCNIATISFRVLLDTYNCHPH